MGSLGLTCPANGVPRPHMPSQWGPLVSLAQPMGSLGLTCLANGVPWSHMPSQWGPSVSHA
eukprot:80298-Prorocentrum_minimum.AAC.1